MSAADYSHLSNSDLIESFIGEADRIGGPLSPTRLKVPVRSAEFARARDTLHAIGAELVQRKPVAELRAQLFENDSPDVRSWAGTLLHAADPEWAEATVNGLFHDLTTQQVLAWRRRLLKTRLPKPNVKKMSVRQVCEYFADACERCYGATRFLTDEEGGGLTMKAYNRAFDDVRAAAEDLRRRGELRTLLSLLDHPLITVRQHAASYCSAVAPDRSIPVLEAIEATKRFPEFINASDTLDRLRKERIAGRKADG